MKITDGQIVDFTKDGVPFAASTILKSTAETSEAPEQESLQPEEDVKKAVTAGNISPMYPVNVPMYVREEPQKQITKTVTTDGTKQDFLQHVQQVSHDSVSQNDRLMDAISKMKSSNLARIEEKINMRIEVLKDLGMPEAQAQIKALEWVLTLLKD